MSPRTLRPAARSVWAILLLVVMIFGALGTVRAEDEDEDEAGGVPPVDQPAACFGCHSNIEAANQMPHVHAAFEDGECSNCHNPHASRHAALLQEEVGDLCTSCHDTIADEMRKPVPHPPVEQGDCTQCHEPHAGKQDYLLVERTGPLCATCHAVSEQWTSQADVHDPVRKGQCYRCHEVHGSSNEHLLTAVVPDVCQQCHAKDPKVERAHPEKAIRESDCTACHDPHASDAPHLLRKNQHAPFAGGDCKACHSSTMGPSAFALEASVQQVCSGCHWEAKSFAEKKYHHNLDDAQSCVNCHEPHAANGEHLLSGDQV
ncbi:MAG: hypothetical protein KC729_21725, partial [Candidatus Eisenbacteria bacterium]|nr:hypothetical protein [Candidatus Eisenbacteria bacterium]